MDKKHRLPTFRGNVNYYKSVHHAIPTLPVETDGKRDLFWKGARRGTTLQYYHLVDICKR